MGRLRLTMRDDDLHTLQAILDARGGFSHREHLELVWTYLGRYEPEQAQRVVADAIRHVARSHGAADKYHETITRCWVHLVTVHRARSTAGSFDDFIAENDGLLDRHLLAAHYSPELLGSPQARGEWTEPDLRPLPLAA